MRSARLAALLVGMSVGAVWPATAAADNDFFEEPFGVVFSGDPVTDSNTAAGVQAGEPLTPAGTGGCGTTSRKMVATKWYWFAGNGGTISVNTVGSNFDTVIAAYEGPTPRSNDPLPCSDDAGGAQTSALSFASVAGRTYLMQVGGCSACGTPSVGSIIMNVSAGPPPPTGVPVPQPVPVPVPSPRVPRRRERVSAKTTLAQDPYYRRLPGGHIEYLGLTIRKLVVGSLPKGTRVEVRCTRGACSFPVKTAKLGGRRAFVFEDRSRGKGIQMTAGTRIYIRATLPGVTGSYVRYRIRRNRLAKLERCLPPGGGKPHRC